MIFLPGFAVVFAGLLGGGGDVGKQVEAILRELHVKSIALPPAKLRTLTHHGEGTRELVRKLHVDGVISFEVVGGVTLRLVIYDRDGALKTYTDMPLGSRGLTSDDRDVLRSNLKDDIASLGPSDDEIEIDPPPPPAPAAPPVASEPTPPAPPAPAAPEDAVSADEIAALTAGGSAPAAAAPAHTLHLGLAAGLGVASRTFDPGPETVAGYRSSPVASVVVEAHVQPTRRTSLAIGTERTLQLATLLRDGTSASTTISRWEASATYAIFDGDFELGPRVGVGRRAFSIDAVDPARSPDGDYNYVLAGVAGAVHLGPHITLRGNLLLEPVVFGTEPTEMAFGEATRWALDAGAALELRPWTHLFARVSATYQRFTWSWSMAGSRGAGGAVDEYPAGALAIGADY